MDTLSHGLSGALLASACTPRRHRPAGREARVWLLAGFVGGVFPDIDFLLRAFGTLFYLQWHQGPTHSLLLVPVWAWLLAQLLSFACRGRYQWQTFFIPLCLGLLAHIAGDVITSYGTMLFAPVSMARFSVPVAFVIDAYFAAIVVLGMAIVLRWPAISRQAALVSLLMLTGYVTFLFSQHQAALSAARAAAGPDEAVYALAQPLSPRHWKLIRAQDDAWLQAHVRIRGESARVPLALTPGLRELAEAYSPVDAANWQWYPRMHAAAEGTVGSAWRAPALRGFRAFAEYPTVLESDHGPGRSCVAFVDLKYTLPGRSPSYRFDACRSDTQGLWQLERRRGSLWLD